MQLKIEELSFGYRCFEVLKSVDLSADSGNLICVLGKNGAGKSTLFRCILGLLKGYKGRIMVDGTDVRELSTKELARKIAYIPQNHDPAFSFTVLDMVLMGTTSSMSVMASPGEKQKAAAYEAMETLGIRHMADRSYGHLSGGEQQLVLIARALAQEAGILVMDEPCANLDYGNQARVMEELKALAAQGYLIIQSTHSPDQAFLYADQAAVLMDGGIKAMGEPSLVLTEEVLKEMYGIPVRLFDTGEENRKLCMPGRIREEN
jgi:iron complex transport system ATP-binding protein